MWPPQILHLKFSNAVTVELRLNFPMSSPQAQMIGYIDMVGDMFHYGHVRQIKAVHDKGFKVVVGVHSDAAVETYKRQPIMTMKERIEVVASCRYVHAVIPNAPLVITEDYLKKHEIDMVFHGHSEEEDHIYNEMYSVPTKLNKFQRTTYTAGISTTDIIDRCKNRYNDE